jgi:hypothetical protein
MQESGLNAVAGKKGRNCSYFTVMQKIFICPGEVMDMEKSEIRGQMRRRMRG